MKIMYSDITGVIAKVLFKTRNTLFCNAFEGRNQFSRTLANTSMMRLHYHSVVCKLLSVCSKLKLLTIFIFVVLFTFSTQSWAVSNKEKKEAALVLESANSNENTYSNGEFVSVLSGNVVFLYEKSRIRSDEATWWRSRGIIKFRNNIAVTTESQKLTCDQMEFTRDKNLLTASGRFKFIDTVERAQLTGDYAEYYLEDKRFLLKGNPRLIRFDTASVETLTISGITMSYNDSLKRATVSDSVKITKGKLFSKCNIAHYFTEENIAWLRMKPQVNYDRSLANGDSINLYFGDDVLKKASVYGNAHGFYTDTMSGGTDTSYTHIKGDSLILAISDSGLIDSLWTYGKAQSEYYASNEPEIVNEASGKVMIMAFGNKGAINNVKIAGNARSRYFIEEQDSRGINEASGDSITVTFRNGKASRLKLFGSARGKYIPNNL